ncbi:MAG: (2Fe-2S) ferredoxin domain-containing protein, partial [Parachlamydiales bacterium]
MNLRVENYQELRQRAEAELKTLNLEEMIQVQVGSATCENASGAEAVYLEIQKHILASGRKDIYLKQVGCTGRCSLEPIVSVRLPKKPLVSYKLVDREKIHEIFIGHILGGSP